jgi:hypothetical protein
MRIIIIFHIKDEIMTKEENHYGKTEKDGESGYCNGMDEPGYG